MMYTVIVLEEVLLQGSIVLSSHQYNSYSSRLRNSVTRYVRTE